MAEHSALWLQGWRDAPPPTALQLLARSLTAATAAALLFVSAAPPSSAEITTVTPQQATEMAKPLKQQEVKKGRIWALFVLGATALFGSTGTSWTRTQLGAEVLVVAAHASLPLTDGHATFRCTPTARRPATPLTPAVLLENNDKWFPAISKANRAVKDARLRAEQQEAAWNAEQAAAEQRLAAVQAERQADLAAEAAVMEGLLEARQRGSAAAQDDVASKSEAAAVTAGSSAPVAPAPAAEEAAVQAPSAAESTADAPVHEAAATKQEEQAGQEEQGDRRSEEPEAAVVAAPSSSSVSGSEPQETRKPLYEITPEQIEASSQRRMRELQEELERRQASAAAPAAGGVSQDP